MSRDLGLFCVRIIVVSLVGGWSGVGWGQTVVFTTDTTINDGDTSYEQFDVTVRGCTLTINGVHSFDSLTVESSAADQPGKVTHAAAFSNGVVNGCHITVTNDVYIEGIGGIGSSLSAEARGFPGSMGPGKGGDGGNAGSGAGYGGAGAVGSIAQGAGPGGGTYGSVMEPTDLGSGGGRDANDSFAGTAGGGAIRLTVGGTLTVDGTISANGGNGSVQEQGAGSGGSLWITVGTLAGSGTISSNGGGGNTTFSGGGGGGRIAIYYDQSSFLGSPVAYGGDGKNGGGAGTVFLKPSGGRGTIIVDNGIVVDDNKFREVTEFTGYNAFDTNLIVRNAGIVGHTPGDAGLHLNFLGDVTVESGMTVDVGGFISADACGFPGSTGPGKGGDGGNVGSGAGYGGAGGFGTVSTRAGPKGGIYGSILQPTDLGSGGGRDANDITPGTSGGGSIRLTVGGTLTVDGTISANGGDVLGQEPGAGSGGSLWITAGRLAGSGMITAHGGAGHTSFSGGGGGGRIALYTGLCIPDSFSGTIAALGGDGVNDGADGTIYESILDCNDDLIPDWCAATIPVPLTGADPLYGSIDSAQPNELDGSNSTGWDSFAITFGDDGTSFVPGDLSVVKHGGDGMPPPFASVILSGPFTFEVTLAEPMEPGTRLSFSVPGSCHYDVSYLPGDLDGNQVSNSLDVTSLAVNLNAGVPHANSPCDVDRSGQCNAFDLIRTLDLLNGAEAYLPWHNIMLP